MKINLALVESFSYEHHRHYKKRVYCWKLFTIENGHIVVHCEMKRNSKISISAFVLKKDLIDYLFFRSSVFIWMISIERFFNSSTKINFVPENSSILFRWTFELISLSLSFAFNLLTNWISSWKIILWGGTLVLFRRQVFFLSLHRFAS